MSGGLEHQIAMIKNACPGKYGPTKKKKKKKNQRRRKNDNDARRADLLSFANRFDRPRERLRDGPTYDPDAVVGRFDGPCFDVLGRSSPLANDPIGDLRDDIVRRYARQSSWANVALRTPQEEVHREFITRNNRVRTDIVRETVNQHHSFDGHFEETRPHMELSDRIVELD